MPADTAEARPIVTVVGVGADGWHGLTDTALTATKNAEVVYGSKRQLDLLPLGLEAELVAWPSRSSPR